MSGRLPDFLIAGFQKCGTTSLFNALNQHPDLSGPVNPPTEKDAAGVFPKELAYFGANFHRGLSWYADRFDSSARMSFEATPYYAASGRVVERIADQLPEARLIFVLRNPVERAYSAWNHWTQLPQEVRSRWQVSNPEGDFSSNVEQEIQQWKPGNGWGFVGMGVYYPQLKKVFQHFSKDRVLVLFLNELQARPGEQLNRTLGFLGVEDVPLNFPVDHRRKYENPMDEATRGQLQEFYEPWNRRLSSLLGEPLLW